jgi:hypothetical protein
LIGSGTKPGGFPGRALRLVLNAPKNSCLSQSLILSLLLIPICLHAAGEVRYPVSWDAVPGAGGYLVEVVNEQKESVFTQRVSENRIMLNLFPGSYSLRITTLNRFIRRESATRWIAFHVPAARPPAFLSIVPDVVLAGRAQSLVVTVDNLSRDGNASLNSPSGRVIPASVERVSRTTLRIGLPALDQIGEYSLALTNPPDLTTTVEAALRVRYPSPTVTALEPDRFQSDHAPRTLRLRGGDFSPQATVSVNVDGNSVDLPAVSREAGDLIVSLSEILEPGKYRLTVRNEPNGDPVEAPILTVTYPDPTITRLEPDQFQIDRIPPTLSLFGGGFSPQVTISMMIDGESVDLPLVSREPGSVRVGLPRALKPGDYSLTVRNAPDAKGVDSPLFHVIPLPPLAAAKVPVRDLLVSGGWNYLIPLSRWADIYSPSPQGAELGVDFYFTPNRASARRASVNAGARVSGQYSSYSSIASSGVFIESVLTMYSLSMAPSLELALPFLMLRLYSGGGVVYSKVEGVDAAGDTQSAESIDFLAMARFAVDVPLFSFLRVGAAAEYRHFFLTEPMDAFLLETGLAVAFPLY